MVNRPKAIGTTAERLVLRHARDHGFPLAERLVLAGQHDRGDIALIPGPRVIVEVKGGEAARSAGHKVVGHWLAETEHERVNAKADVGLLVVQRLNRATTGAAGWQAWLPAWTVADLLTGQRGYATITETPAYLVDDAPWSTTFEHALQLLRAAGYGDPLEPR